MGELTKDRPKSMVRLANGETIFHRQLRILHVCGISEFIVTTGPFAGMLEAEAEPFRRAGCTFSFVPNPIYDTTNYIYSMYLARSLLHGSDLVMLHGDLVFDASYAQIVIDSGLPSLGSVNATLPLPEKDFKARIADGEVREVSVGIIDANCVAFQPFYKLSADSMETWIEAVDRFVKSGKTGVYAENAANTVFGQMHVAAFSYEGHFVEEVDTPEDLERVSAGIRLFDFAQQPVFRAVGDSLEIVDGCALGALRDVRDVSDLLSALRMSKPLVVASKHFAGFNVVRQLDDAGIDYEIFTDFASNPTFDDVNRALTAYRRYGCDSLLSVGGGSAIDVAKCVKQLLPMKEGANGEALKSKGLPYSRIPHIAVPTTAGTGSESTHFAVCYIEGQKVSVANDCLQPDVAILDASNLAGLPSYQRKCTMLDALCQAVESYWSSKSCVTSRAYSAAAISAINENVESYLMGDMDSTWQVMFAANRSGKAINLTTTTAPHAMSYKLTSMYGIPHGHAVAMCMPYCWRALLDRSDEGLNAELTELAVIMTGKNDAEPIDGLTAFNSFFRSLDLDNSVSSTSDDIAELVSSVNNKRLSNFPITMFEDEIEAIYRKIVINRA